MADVVAAALADGVGRLLAHEAGVREGSDPEAVHQARVAVRRLRSDLRTFERFVERDAGEHLVRELRWLGGELGRVRDADVLLERFGPEVADLPAADAEGGAALLGRLALERHAARARTIEAMDGDRYRGLLSGLAAAAAEAPVIEGARRVPASSALRQAVRGEWRDVRRAVRSLGRDPSDADLHRVRVLAKRCRYGGEAARPVLGRPAAQLAKQLARVQRVLGELQDAVVAEAWLRGAAAAGSAAEAVAAGQLVVSARAARARRRGEWRAAWDAVERPRL
jgi:CHAD domain-containing protein